MPYILILTALSALAICAPALAGGPIPAGYSVYLPITQSGGTATNVPPPPPPAERFTRWLPDINTQGSPVATYRTSVAVDAAGGLHTLYTRYGSGADLLTPAIYAYCPQSCASAASWTRIHLGDGFLDAELQLDPQGHPRAMLFGSARDPNSTLRMMYTYATCDSSCTDPAAWALTPLVAPLEPQALRSEHNNRYFALDPQGHPAYIYSDTANEHPGTWYAYCAGPIAGCADAASWTETRLSQGLLGNASLVFNPQGQPRLTIDFYNSDRSINEVWYGACDAGCDAPEGWDWKHLWDMHGSGRVHMRVDPQGRPRAIFYSGNYASAPFNPGRLYYAWCDTGCTSADWGFYDIGLTTTAGAESDLVLDVQGNPRVAFADGSSGLGYAWCNVGCAGGTAAWLSGAVERSVALSSDFEVLPIHRCTISTWLNGNRPWLALDAAGNPRIGYDAEHWWYGVELNGGGARQCNDQDITVTRVAAFPQPAP